MRLAICVGLVGLAGCEKDLLSGLPDSEVTPPPISCPASNPPLAAGDFKLYLNADGVTLQKCARDDARTNCAASVIQVDTAIIPPFLPAAPDREAIICDIVARAQGALAPYSIDIVTTRPSTGEYEMVVLGTDPSTAGLDPMTKNLTPVMCSFLVVGVAVMFDNGQTRAGYASLMLHDLGFMVGLGSTMLHDDCQGQVSGVSDSLCTFSDAAPTDSVDCGRGPTQNEPALLEVALGAR